MSVKQSINEKMNIHPEWYERANTIKTTEDAKQFADNLINDYQHDYGTICHAIAASSLAMFNSLAHEAGITGFQSSCIAWEIMRNLFHLKGAAKLVDFEQMLFPQYEYKFEKTISKDTFSWLQEEAKKRLEEDEGFMHESVRNHMQSIVDGVVPFGFTLTDK